MKHYKRHLIATAAVCILGVSATVVNAETVTTKTVVSTKHLNGVDRVNFASFDLNGDGILSMSEVGERLFYAFDMDGNEVIDNIEMNKKSVMTIPSLPLVFTFCPSTWTSTPAGMTTGFLPIRDILKTSFS